ncbi:chorismate mutase [Paracraurococcus lichenis]|uniref:chorismate mutase n=1 Tax=Paracraurococcus lichenis TaxID=3064888 RepID=A0ABT9DYX5_9PROT|nr:chorismate mutase [Paracraurococcus sp. LOR1-02]MDO9709086.1 chorismate mutase [Paracraurococcus sp. LOR1-02]
MTAASDTKTAPATPAATAPGTPPEALAALRAEIDRLDDQLHDLVMRRAEVVASLAASGVKRGGSPLRPGREAMILRRLLARHAGALPGGAVVRLWREIFGASSAMQGGFTVAVYAREEAQLRLARDHFGGAIPLRPLPTAARALAAVAAGEAQVAVLPAPEEGEPAEQAWWTGLDAPRLQVVARLPFWSEGEAAALAVAPGAADPSGDDRSLLRLEMAGDRGRAQVAAALAAAGLPPRSLLLRRDGGVVRALAEIDGVVEDGDARLAALPFDRALPLGFHAVPERGNPG